MKAQYSFQKIKLVSQKGRIRPFMLAVIIIAAGLSMDQWWWMVGLGIIIVLFIEAYYRYRTLD